MKLFPVTEIAGPRQVGKTTLVKSKLKGDHFLYLDLERRADREKLRGDTVFFLSQFQERCVVLDEIQFMPELFSEIRGLVDENRRPGRFILLGSASPELIQGTSETLAGRIGYLELTPFNLKEVTEPNRLWLRGGFPDSYLAENGETSMLWRNHFIQTYNHRDLGLLELNAGIKVMERYWQLIASSQGGLLNAQQFGRNLDVSQPTIKRYLDFLEGAFILKVLPLWHRNLKKRLMKSPKVYLRDSGILHSLLGLQTKENLLNHFIVGASREGFVIEQIISCFQGKRQFYFYRTHQGAECDLLIEREGIVMAAIEIKLGASPNVSKGFRISMEDTNAAEGFIIGTGKDTYKMEENITVTNLPYFIQNFLPNL